MAASLASRWPGRFLKLRGDAFAARCLATSQTPLIEEKSYSWLKDLGLDAENPGKHLEIYIEDNRLIDHMCESRAIASLTSCYRYLPS